MWVQLGCVWVISGHSRDLATGISLGNGSLVAALDPGCLEKVGAGPSRGQRLGLGLEHLLFTLSTPMFILITSTSLSSGPPKSGQISPSFITLSPVQAQGLSYGRSQVLSSECMTNGQLLLPPSKPSLWPPHHPKWAILYLIGSPRFEGLPRLTHSGTHTAMG